MTIIDEGGKDALKKINIVGFLFYFVWLLARFVL